MTSSPRRLSFSSVSSDSSDNDRGSPVPHGSSSALILVHDPEEDIPFDFASDDQDLWETQFDSLSSSEPPLSPNSIFIYLLTPNLKLGAMFLPNTDLSLELSLLSLIAFALFSVFVKYIWYLLARRLGRQTRLEDIILDTFARARGKERHRAILRCLVRAGTSSLNVLLAAVYLRESTQTLCFLLPDALLLSRAIPMTLLLVVLLLPFLPARNIAWRRITFSAWASAVTYILWLILVAVARAMGRLHASAGWANRGILWQGITTTAFAFASSGTVSLLASKKAAKQPNLTKTSKLRSFRSIFVVAVAIATLLMLPVALFSVYPQHATITPFELQPFIAVLSAATLLLSIPYLLITAPSIPISPRIRQSVRFSISKCILFVAFLAISLLPTVWTGIINDIVLVAALLSTYFLPAVLHVATHYFKRPISIVVPTPDTPLTSSPQPSAQDELLLRKERALQKRQLKKRIIWDIGVWLLLIPVCGGGFVWAASRLAGRW